MELLTPVALATLDNPTERDAKNVGELLAAELGKARGEIERHERYLVGDFQVKFDSNAFRAKFARQLASIAVNLCPLVVDSAVERLHGKSIQFGGVPDSDAWRMWQGNDMDRRQSMIYRTAIATGRSYLLASLDDQRGVRWQPEHPSQMIHARDPETGDVSAALKEWTVLGADGKRETLRTVYLPGRVYRMRLRAEAGYFQGRFLPEGPSLRTGTHADIIDLPTKVVPVVPYNNNEDMFGGGSSDLRDVEPLVDALNKLMRDRLAGSDALAYPLLVAMGVETPIDPATRQPVPGADRIDFAKRLVMLPGEHAKVQQFQPNDGAGLTAAVDQTVKLIAVISKLPVHYFIGGTGNFPSGDSLDAAEAGLTARVEGKASDFGAAHEQAARVSFALLGDARATDPLASVSWRRPQRRSLAERVDSFQKLYASGNGTSLEYAMAYALDASPEEIQLELARKGFPNRTPDDVPAEPAPTRGLNPPAPVAPKE